MAIQELKSNTSKTLVDGEHGWKIADYIDRDPKEGEYVEVRQYFAWVGISRSKESIPEPVEIVKIASRPESYWGAEHGSGSYDFRERTFLSRGRRLVKTHDSDGGHVQFHKADEDQGDVRNVHCMSLWGRIVGGKLVPVK